jgi:hypothetical protein
MPFQLLPKAEHCPNRRDVLKGMALGGASLAIGRSAMAATAEKDNGPWYALVSDIHIAADPSAKARGECMTDNLRAVVADILASEAPPLGVLIDGDLAYNHGELGDYQQVLSVLEPLRKAKLPITLAMGNHDERAHFRAALNIDPPKDSEVVDRVVSTVSLPGLRFVVLDSLDKTNKTPGVLGERQLAWLAKELDADDKTPTLVFLHHNLAKRPGALIEADAEALRAVLKPRTQVKALVYGHTHVWDLQEEDGLHLINLPAVAYRFAATQPLGWCRLRLNKNDGAELELRCVAGDRSKDGQRVPLRWRA